MDGPPSYGGPEIAIQPKVILHVTCVAWRVAWRCLAASTDNEPSKGLAVFHDRYSAATPKQDTYQGNSVPVPSLAVT